MYTKRLQKLIDALPQCNVLADVGCDHGYVGIEALKSGVAGQVVFVDVSVRSLQKARQNCPEELKMRAEFVCRNGLGPIWADCAVIAGMGGLETISVLEGAKRLPEKLVLQPMRNQREVRIWLSQRYEILSDKLFFDGKFYDLITAQKSPNGCVLTPDEALFGKDNLIAPTLDFEAYLQKQIKEYQQILQQCNDAEIVEKHNTALRIFAQISEVRK